MAAAALRALVLTMLALGIPITASADGAFPGALRDLGHCLVAAPNWRLQIFPDVLPPPDPEPPRFIPEGAFATVDVILTYTIADMLVLATNPDIGHGILSVSCWLRRANRIAYYGIVGRDPCTGAWAAEFDTRWVTTGLAWHDAANGIDRIRMIGGFVDLPAPTSLYQVWVSPPEGLYGPIMYAEVSILASQQPDLTKRGGDFGWEEWWYIPADAPRCPPPPPWLLE